MENSNVRRRKVDVLAFVRLIVGSVVALMLDHFGLLGLSVNHITAGRVVGVSVMIVGLVITQISKVPSPVRAAHNVTQAQKTDGR
ncbi:DMT family transporter [Cupriavidus pauculus]|uniref:DMT family transporter n=1 Tax=Cupriavidus pauculus TaxID=82633 RepID=UPI0011AF7280